MIKKIGLRKIRKGKKKILLILPLIIAILALILVVLLNAKESKGIKENIIQIPGIKKDTAAAGRVPFTFPDQNLHNKILERLKAYGSGTGTIIDMTDTSYRKNQNDNTIYEDELAKIKMLEIQNANIIDITGMEKLTSLQWLYLDSNKIVNISPLRNLTKLEHLGFDNNKVVDLEPLRNMSGLKSLNAINNKIVDLEPLRNVDGLMHLFIQNNQIENIEPLRNFAHTWRFEIFNNKIRNLSYISPTIIRATYYNPQNIDIAAVNNKFTLDLVDPKGVPIYIVNPRIERIRNTNEYRIKGITNLNKITIAVNNSENKATWNISIKPNKPKIVLRYKKDNSVVKTEEREYEPNAENGIIVGSRIQNAGKTYRILNKGNVPARITENGEYDIPVIDKNRITINYKDEGKSNAIVKTVRLSLDIDTAIVIPAELNEPEKDYKITNKNSVPSRALLDGEHDVYVKEIPRLTGNPTPETIKKGSRIELQNLRNNLPGLPSNANIVDEGGSVGGFNSVTAPGGRGTVNVRINFANGTHRIVSVPITVDPNLRITINYKDMDKGNILVKPEPKNVVYGNAISIPDIINHGQKEYKIINKSSVPARITEHGRTYDVFVKEIPQINGVISAKTVKKGITLTPELLRSSIPGLPANASISDVEGSVAGFNTLTPKTGNETVRVKVTFENGTHRIVTVPIQVINEMDVNIIYKNREASNTVIKRDSNVKVTYGTKATIPTEFREGNKDWVVVDKTEADANVTTDKDINIIVIEKPAPPTFGDSNSTTLTISVPRGIEPTSEKLLEEIHRGGRNSNVTGVRLKPKTSGDAVGTRKAEITYTNVTKREITVQIIERDTVTNTVRYNIGNRKVLETQVTSTIGQKINIPQKITGTDTKTYIVQNYASRVNATNNESTIYDLEVLEESRIEEFRVKSENGKITVKKGQYLDLNNIFEGVQNGNGVTITDVTAGGADVNTPGENIARIRVERPGKEPIVLEVPIVVDDRLTVILVYKDLERENVVVDRKRVVKTYGESITLDNRLIKEGKEYFVTDSSNIPARIVREGELEIFVKEVPMFVGNTNSETDSDNNAENPYDLVVKLVNGELLTPEKILEELKKDGNNLEVERAEILLESKVKLIYSNGTERVITVKKKEVVRPREEDYVPIENIVLEKGDIIDVNKLFEGKVSGDGENTITFEEIDTNEVGRKILNVKVTSKDGESISYQIPITIVGEKEVTVTAEYIENGEKKEIVLDPKIMNIGEKLMLDEILTINGRKFRIAEYGDRPVVTNNKEKKYKIVLKEQISAAIIQPIEPEGTKAIEIPNINIKLGESLDILKEIRKVAGNDVVVEDVTEPRIDINKPGNYIAKIRVTYPGGGSKIISVPIYVSDKIDVKLVMKLEDGRILKQIDKEVIIGKKITKEELIDLVPEGYKIDNVEDVEILNEEGQKISVQISKINKVNVIGNLDLPYSFPEDIEIIVELHRDRSKTGRIARLTNKDLNYEFKELNETDKLGKKHKYTITVLNLDYINSRGYEVIIDETGKILVMKKVTKKDKDNVKESGNVKDYRNTETKELLPYAGLNSAEVVKMVVAAMVIASVGYLVKVYVKR